MNKHQLTEYVIKPTLSKMPLGLTDESVMAVEMIIAHESSRGKYIHQISGPALGLGQIEPATHNDTWKHGDSIWLNALAMGIVSESDYKHKTHPKPERMIYDLSYTVFMIRQRLFMKPEKLPSSAGAMSIYLKKHWNTVLGKANDYSYLNDWKDWK